MEKGVGKQFNQNAALSKGSERVPNLIKVTSVIAFLILSINGLYGNSFEY